MTIQTETELYVPVKEFMENLGFEVKGEVKSCDLVALHPKEEEPVIIELKKTFNLSLLFQGFDRLKLSKRVYLAVEHVKGRKRPAHLKWSNVKQLCQKLELGLITVQFYKTKKPHVEILCHPTVELSNEQLSNEQPISQKRVSKKKARLIHEFKERSGDYNVGGSNKTKLITAYRELALECARFIQLHGPLSPLQLREFTGKQKVTSILQINYYNWFERVKRGIYQLTSEGEEALKLYDKVLKQAKEQPSTLD